MLDAARNEDALDEVERGFMALKNTDIVRVGSIEDGSMLIFVSKEDMEPLNFFLNEKGNEVYLYLKERDGINIGIEYDD